MAIKSTGIVRSIDDLGRIVIPKEIRTTHDIKKTDPVEIFTDGEYVLLRKYNPGCIFCGHIENAEDFKGKLICEDCRDQINSQEHTHTHTQEQTHTHTA